MKTLTNDQRKFAEKNIGLVRYIMATYTRFALNDEDAYQVACMALLKAVQLYNPSLGFKFSSYLTPFIVRSVNKYYRNLRIRSKYISPMSLDEPINLRHVDDKEISRLDLIESNELPIEISVMYSQAITMLDHLPDRQKRAVILYYLYGFSQTEIGTMLVASQMTISRELMRALRDLSMLLDEDNTVA